MKNFIHFNINRNVNYLEHFHYFEPKRLQSNLLKGGISDTPLISVKDKIEQKLHQTIHLIKIIIINLNKFR